jgi:CRP/FNR family transcriptional regulator
MEILGLKSSCKNCPYKTLVFDALDNKELDFIDNSRKEILYKKGEVIAEEGNVIEEFLYLKTGLLKVYRKGRGNKDQIIRIAGASDFVSLLSMFSNEKYKYSLSALEDTIVCVVDAEKIKNLVRTNGEFALDVIGRMSYTYDEIIDSTYRIRQKQLRGRIAHILLYFSNTVYKNDRFELPLSRREIAELINMTTENVIRILSEFRKDKIIQIEKKTIIIIDKERLEKINKTG